MESKVPLDQEEDAPELKFKIEEPPPEPGKNYDAYLIKSTKYETKAKPKEST